MLPPPFLVIGDEVHEAGARLRVEDRSTGEHLSDVVTATHAQAEDAVVVAETAFEASRALSGAARRRILRNIGRGLVEHRDRLARIICAEAGKPISLAKAEVDRAIVTVGLASEETTRHKGEVLALDISDATAMYSGHHVRVPRGPVLGITPFNFPLNLVAHKLAPAIACGASLVLKPAPQTPLTALVLAEIVRASGGPPGLFTVLPCENDVAERLVRDDRLRTLAFTGSAEVGWRLKAIAGKKHVVLELGGNAAAIVHEDAPSLALAAQLVCGSAFNYAGQVCIKTQRVYVHRPIAERFMSEIVQRASLYAPQDPRDELATMGPMVSEAHAERVEAWVGEALEAGAVPLVAGRREGSRMPAIVLRIDGAGKGLAVVDEEVFGPVLTVHVYDTWIDALRLAGDTRYGLQASVFTDSVSRVREAFAKLAVGTLVVNDAASVRVDSMPYGGTRDSGMGREGVRWAMEEMSEVKAMVVRG